MLLSQFGYLFLYPNMHKNQLTIYKAGSGGYGGYIGYKIDNFN